MRGVLTSLIGVEYDPGHRVCAAADRDRHRQRPVGQIGIVMLRHGEPDDPPRPHIEHAVQVQLALIGDDLGAVAKPLLVELVRANWRFTKSGARHGRGRAGSWSSAAASAGLEALLGHDLGDGVLTHPPPHMHADPR